MEKTPQSVPLDRYKYPYKNRSKTMAVALADMMDKYQIRCGDMTAVAVISAIFTVVPALVFQKHLPRGLAAGGVKG